MMAKHAFSILIWAVFLGAVFFYLRYIERRTIFYPDKKLEFSPPQLGLDKFEDVFFVTADKIRLHGWFIPVENSRKTVLYCHGNAGNISHRIEKAMFFNRLGCSVFIFDYRGYGKSAGRPSEQGLYRDVEAAYEYLLSRPVDAGRIVGYGESLGGAVIIELAYGRRLSALISDSAFSSAKDMANYIYPYLPHWLFSSRFDSLQKVKQINIPKLFIHSVNDEIVPFELGRKLYEAAGDPKEFLQIHGGHNSCFYESEEILEDKIGYFLDRL